MARKDREELQAFAQKMHDEGAAGFASGLTPWETWDDFEDRVGSRVWQGTSERVADRELPSRSFGDRVLTTMTALAVATLVIGIAGLYMTQESALQVADNRAQLPSTRPAMTPETLPPRQGAAIDSQEENVALNTAWIPATETLSSPAADRITTMDMAAAPSGAIIPVAPPAGETTGTGIATSAPEPDTDSQLALAALNDLPAPAAGTPATAVDNTAHARPAASALSEPAPESAGDTEPGQPETVASGPGNSAPVQPVHLSGLTLLDVHTEPRQAPGQDTRPNAQAGNSGDWSINIASYLKQPTAEKMRSRFLDKGVATDMVTAMVNGKTYYRLRVTGFESRATASTQSTTIKEKLGLEEVWITKQ